MSRTQGAAFDPLQTSEAQRRQVYRYPGPTRASLGRRQQATITTSTEEERQHQRACLQNMCPGRENKPTSELFGFYPSAHPVACRWI